MEGSTARARPAPRAAAGRPRAGAADAREGAELDDVEEAPDPSLDFRTCDATGAQAVGHVLRHRHMREQRIVLEDDTDVASIGGEMVDRCAVDANTARRLTYKTRDDAQQDGLAAARRTEESPTSPGSMAGLTRRRPPTTCHSARSALRHRVVRAAGWLNDAAVVFWLVDFMSALPPRSTRQCACQDDKRRFTGVKVGFDFAMAQFVHKLWHNVHIVESSTQNKPLLDATPQGDVAADRAVYEAIRQALLMGRLRPEQSCAKRLWAPPQGQPRARA